MIGLCVKYFLHNSFKQTHKLHKHIKFTRYKECFGFTTIHNISIPQIAGLSTSSTFLRVFKDKENVYAYNIIQALPITKNPPIFSITNSVDNLYDFNNRLNQNWRSKSASEIVECFKSVLNYCIENDINLSDTRFDHLVDGLMDNVQDLTDSNLCDLFQCLIRLPLCDSYMSHNFHDVWSALDDVCCWKINNWSTQTMLLFAEYWYRLNLGRICKYSTCLIETLTTHSQQLTKSELIQLFFYININRKSLSFNFEASIERHLNVLSADEMAVIAMGFFKSQTPIRLTYILIQMMERVKTEIKNVHEITLTAILKVLRYSSNALLIDQLLDLLDHLVPEIHRLSNVCCTHIALLGTTLQFFHESSLEKVAEKILRDINNVEVVRIKDMERLLLALTMFNYKPNTERDIYDAIFEELHREERESEYVKHPRCLPCILHYLSLKKIYSHKLMNKILNKEYIFEIFGKYPKKLSRDIFFLDVCIDVDCRDYVGNRLDPSFRRKAAKWMVEYTPTWDQYKKLTPADRFTLDVIDTVAKVVNGRQNIRTDHILPNFVKSDIIICSDGNQFVPPSGFESYQLGDVMYPARTNLVHYAIVPVNWNMCIRDTSIPLGLIQRKLQLLKTLDYQPVMVVWNEFMPLNEEQKIMYIRNKIDCK